MGFSRCLYLLFRWIGLFFWAASRLSQAQSIQWSPYVQSYPAPQIPLGYQPPPTGPVVNEYSSDAFYQQPAQPRQQQKLTMVHVRNNGQPQQHWTPNQQQQFQFQQQQVAQNVNQQQNWQPKIASPPEPLLINTLIQVFSHDDPYGALSLGEARAVTAVNNKQQPEVEAVLNGQNRVVLTRQLDTQARTFLPPPTQVAPASRRNESPNQLLAVKAFAATNSSKISTAELEMELNKELESSIPMILEELDKVEKAQKQLQKSNAIPPQAIPLPVAPNKPSNQVGEVDTTDLEKLIEEGLATIEQEETTTTFTTQTLTTATTMPLIIFSKTSQIYTTTTTTSTTTTTTTTPPAPAPQELIPEAEEPTDGGEQLGQGEHWAITEAPFVVTDIVKLGEGEIKATTAPEKTRIPESEFQEDHITQPSLTDSNSEQEFEKTTSESGQTTAPIHGQAPVERTEGGEEVSTVATTSQPAVTPEPTQEQVETSKNAGEATMATTVGQEIGEKTGEGLKNSSEQATTTTTTATTSQPIVTPEAAQVEKTSESAGEIVEQTEALIEKTPKTPGEITTVTTVGQEIGQKTMTVTEEKMATSQLIPAPETSQATEIPATGSEEEALSTGPSFVAEGSGVESTTQAAGTKTMKSVQENEESASPLQTTIEGKEVVSVGTTTAFAEDVTTVPFVVVEETITNTPLVSIPTSTLAVSDYQEFGPNMPEITSTSEEPSQETCPEPSADGGNVKGDVLFLLDSSSSVGAEQFQRSVQLIHDTVKHLPSVGPNGIQVSLIQYNREPFLEFTFRRHNCLSNMLSDIADTEFMNGVSNLGRAIEKVMKFAFTKSRGDRPEAENVVVLVTDGRSDDEWQVPLELAKSNGTTMLVIATVKANKTDLMMLADDRKQNLFNLTEVALSIPLAERLAKRIEQVATQQVLPSPTPPQTIGNEVQPSSGEQNGEPSAPAENNDQLVSERTSSSMESSSPPAATTSLTDPTVSVECLSDGIKAVFHLASSFKGSIVAKDAVEDPDCSKDIQPADSDHLQDMKTVEMEIRSPNCGLHLMKSELPKGQNISIVLNVIHDKGLVTGVDRSFIIQCFVPMSLSDLQNEGVLGGEEVETTLKILPGIALSKTISLERTPPKCNYSLRRDSPNGAILQAAAVGQILFHRWECDGGKDSNSVFGVYVHDCRATNHSSQEGAKSYSIIDKNGCTADPSLLGEVIYAEDRLLAYAKAFVFTLRNVDSLKFSCKIGLCVRNGDGCEGYSPPTCNSSNVSEMLLSSKNKRLQDSAIDAALTSPVDSPKIAVMSASAFGGGGGKGARLIGGMSGPHWRRLSSWSIAIFLISAMVLGSILGVACFLISRRWKNYPSASLLDEEEGKSLSRPSSGHGEEYFQNAHAHPVLVDWSANRITRLGAPPTPGREDRLSEVGDGVGIASQTHRVARLQQQRNDTLDGT